MSEPRRLLLSRRDLLKAGGLAAVAAGPPPRPGRSWSGPSSSPTTPSPRTGRRTSSSSGRTAGSACRRPRPSSPRRWASRSTPTATRPTTSTTYIFGFANASGLADNVQFNLKNKAQHSAPLFWAREGVDFRIQLTNVGLAQRPDLFDEHTVHWHGFKNVIPFFDGEPTGSVSIPQGQTFTYVYLSHDPGTYMFHCHVEDTEHVQMGMTGIVFVRPAQDGTNSRRLHEVRLQRRRRLDRRSTASSCMFLSEVLGDSHWADAHIQLPEWSDYRADFSLLNGRVYPDTLASNGSIARHGDNPSS